MTNSHPFVHVYSGGLDGCTLSRDLPLRAPVNWLCPGCGYAKPGVAPIDVCVQEARMPLRRVMESVLLLGLVHRSFLAELDENVVARDLILGKVFLESGRCVDDWHTFRCRHRIIVRGSKHAGARVCDECHQVLYSATGRRYLYPEPPADADIFESQLAGLVFRSHLLEHIDLKKYRKLIVDRLPILDPPPDGLGVLQCE